jgi:hypothetical protein
MLPRSLFTYHPTSQRYESQMLIAIVGWNPTQGMDVRCVCVCVYSVFMLSIFQAEALRRTDHPYKESVKMINEAEKSVLCSEVGSKRKKRNTS